MQCLCCVRMQLVPLSLSIVRLLVRFGRSLLVSPPTCHSQPSGRQCWPNDLQVCLASAAVCLSWVPALPALAGHAVMSDTPLAVTQRARRVVRAINPSISSRWLCCLAVPRGPQQQHAAAPTAVHMCARGLCLHQSRAWATDDCWWTKWRQRVPVLRAGHRVRLQALAISERAVQMLVTCQRVVPRLALKGQCSCDCCNTAACALCSNVELRPPRC
jgi:hypothetical protein